MKLKILSDDGKLTSHSINKASFFDAKLSNSVGYIGTASKEENALNIFRAYFSDAKVILLDESNKTIVQRVEQLSVEKFGSVEAKKTVFSEQDFSFLYFTSGSTGVPVGALKTKAHIESEVAVLTKLLSSYGIKRVVVTVPFIHLYGTLLGLMYPLLNGIDIILKEHFLPHDLLEMIEPHTMVVTTPLYIKALNKLDEKKDLSSSLFVSSTAPLDAKSANGFHSKFKSDVLQIFGSTETGGIAYKLNDAELWKGFKSVELSTNDAGELHVASPFVSDVLYEDGFSKIEGAIQTFDYIEQEEEGFRLVGRSSKIFKIAGKRYSTLQIEEILEAVEGIEKALVFVEMSRDELRGEYLEITLESKESFTVREIKVILKKHLSNLKFSMKLSIVDKIPTSLVGKKLRI